MLIACWSPKGGSGTTVVACSLALILARSAPAGALLADLGGDVPAVLGLAEPDGPGLLQWLAADGDVSADALRRIEMAAGPELRVLPAGAAPAEPPGSGASHGGARPGSGRDNELVSVLAADTRPVVADCGPGPAGAGFAVAAGASLSLLVVRPCYLALRRAANFPIRPSGVILVREDQRSFKRSDVESVLGVPVRAEVDVNPAIARAVDGGLLAHRVPRTLQRALEGAA
jgi:MinD superfamily P-loop ATPase